MSTIQIKQANPTDCKELFNVIKKVVLAIPYYNDLAKESEISKFNPENLINKIKEDNNSVLIALSDDSIVGFCLTRFDDYLIWLEWFGVLEEFRGMGIANMLLDRLDKTIVKRKCHKIWCDCRTTNKASIHILSKHGFNQIATVENHWYKQDFILWHKLI